MVNTHDLWRLSTTPKYGSRNDYPVSRILVVFEGKGLCSYSENGDQEFVRNVSQAKFAFDHEAIRKYK